ncbi:hypothetical protein RTP6_006739 [Batrachochytrium dendrobatidis]
MASDMDNGTRLRANAAKQSKPFDSAVSNPTHSSVPSDATSKEPPRAFSISGTRFIDFIEAAHACIRMFKAFLYSLLAVWVAYGSSAMVHRGGNFDNTLIIIGDDFAAGVGDNPNLGNIPGLARFLARELAKESRIKQTWSIFNCGVKGSTSFQWLPSSEQTASQKHPTHFERLFEKPKYARAQVVILLVGFNDSRSAMTTGVEISPEQTIGNIHSICKALQDMGKDVYVCPVANTGDSNVSDAVLEQNMRLNTMILEYTTRGDKEHVFAGPNIDVMNFEYRVDRYYDEDKMHFNAKGYEKFAKDFVDVIANRLVKIEFAKFSKVLGLNK